MTLASFACLLYAAPALAAARSCADVVTPGDLRAAFGAYADTLSLKESRDRDGLGCAYFEPRKRQSRASIARMLPKEPAVGISLQEMAAPGDGERALEQKRKEVAFFGRPADAGVGAESFVFTMAARPGVGSGGATVTALDSSRHFLLTVAARGRPKPEALVALAKKIEARVSRWSKPFEAVEAPGAKTGGSALDMDGLRLELPPECYDLGSRGFEGRFRCALGDAAFDAWLWPALEAQGWKRLPPPEQPKDGLGAMAGALGARAAAKGDRTISILWTRGGGTILMSSRRR
ncbi:MAG: hypothetical protein HY553_07230 [Elusimicrobia bacterium]|nr:hypothetical protein [Elusimicrobiota bacterium]